MLTIISIADINTNPETSYKKIRKREVSYNLIKIKLPYDRYNYRYNKTHQLSGQIKLPYTINYLHKIFNKHSVDVYTYTHTRARARYITYKV